MKRWVAGGLVVAAAFAFTVLMFLGAGWKTAPEAVNYLCAHLMWTGMAITINWLHRPLLGIISSL
jgi:hypothetical protein